jgi:hypothetical protein
MNKTSTRTGVKVVQGKAVGEMLYMGKDRQCHMSIRKSRFFPFDSIPQGNAQHSVDRSSPRINTPIRMRPWRHVGRIVGVFPKDTVRSPSKRHGHGAVDGFVSLPPFSPHDGHAVTVTVESLLLSNRRQDASWNARERPRRQC